MDTPITTHAEASPSLVGWQGRLNEVATAREVAAVTREFLARLDAHEVAQLPEGLRPSAIGNARNVVYYALKLAHAYSGDAKSQPVLHRVSSFLTKAALRIVQIDEQRLAIERETGSSA